MYNYVHTHTDTISTWNKNMQRQNLQKEKAKKKKHTKATPVMKVCFLCFFIQYSLSLIFKFVIS